MSLGCHSYLGWITIKNCVIFLVKLAFNGRFHAYQMKFSDMPDIRCSAWHVTQTRPAWLICPVSFDNISLVRFLFLLVFIFLSLVCGIVYMFVC